MFIKLRWCVLLCLGISAQTTLSVSAAQDAPTTDGVVVVRGSADPLAGGGASRPTVLGLGFTVDPNLVLAYLPEDHGELTVFDVNGRQLVAALRFRDPASSLSLLSVPGLGVTPYLFMSAGPVRPGQEVWGVALDAVPGNDNRLLLEEGRVRAGNDSSPFELLAPIEVEGLGARGFSLGAPVLNECGQVVGVRATNLEMAISSTRLQQMFSGESWVPPRASQQCLGQEQADSVALAVQDSLAQVMQAAQDSMTAMAARLRELASRPVPDQNPEEIQELRDAIESQQAESRRLQAVIDSLSAVSQPEAGVPLWAMVVGLSVLVALGLVGVVRLRSGAGAGSAGVETPVAQPLSPSPAPVARALPAAPSVFLEGSDRKGNRFSVAVPANDLGSPDGVVVGRNPYQSKVVIDHPEVSRRHLRLHYSEGRILVEDLGSTNKTKVGSAVLTPGVRAELRDGDTLQVGSLALRPTIRR